MVKQSSQRNQEGTITASEVLQGTTDPQLLTWLKKQKRRTHFYIHYWRPYLGMRCMDILPGWLVKKLQERKLQELITHCYIHVPYYRNMFKRLNILPTDIKTIDDLKKLPVLTKEDIIRNETELFADNVPPKDRLRRFTSGTTGIPMNVHSTVQEDHVEYVNRKIEGDMAKQDFFDAKIGIGHLWSEQLRWDQYNQVLHIQKTFISAKNLKTMMNEIRLRNPRSIIGRPSLLCALASYLSDAGEKLTFDAVFTKAEALYPSQRKIIKKAFSCEVFEGYSQKEMSVRAMECTAHRGMHLEPWYGITEIASGGRIIATPLFKRAFPLLRYDTQDHGVITHGPCPCKRSTPRLLRIKGRESDFLITEKGDPIDNFLIFKIMGVHQGLIKGCCFKQIKSGKVIAFASLVDQKDRQRVKNTIIGNLRPYFPIEVRFVNKLPLARSGKLRLIQSAMKVEFLNT